MAKQNTEQVTAVEIVTPEPIGDTIRRLMREHDSEFRDETRHYYTALQLDYTSRIAEIEKFLGFVESAEGLGRRLERLEQFLGVRG